MEFEYNFGGYATKANLKCADGLTIMKDAFKDNDGAQVPLIWNHDHSDPSNVLGHAILENREDGVYAYCSFNDTDKAKGAWSQVQHGDIKSLSIWANQLKKNAGDVIHGTIREVSLVLAGANPGALIDSIIVHGIESDDEALITIGEPECALELYHAASDDKQADENGEGAEKTVGQIYEEMTEEQKLVCQAMVGMALENAEKSDDKDNIEHSEGGNESMKANVFDKDTQQDTTVLSHSAQEAIINIAKAPNVGSLQMAIGMYAEQNELKHGIDEIETLFPEYKDVYPGAPELIERDMTWVMQVMRKTHKSPISRIRTRQADARGADLRAKGYQKKGDLKTESGNIKLMGRTTDPQTVYRKDAMHRDDIIDITDFDVVEYNYGVMKNNLYEDLALATMVGDLREDGDPDKIHEEHIRPIWKDNELYTIHYDVDIEAAKKELQGSDTDVHFGENYIYAEAIITAALYSREEYRGSGNLEFYCTPHLLNVMLLARDLNGRRIYDSKADLAKALNVSAIHTAEQFEGLTRTTDDGKKKELLGLFVNLSDYQHGSTKGGEITRFEQFDIDFNQQKYLIETRLSGALTRIKSAIALEKPVND